MMTPFYMDVLKYIRTQKLIFSTDNNIKKEDIDNLISLEISWKGNRNLNILI